MFTGACYLSSELTDCRFLHQYDLVLVVVRQTPTLSFFFFNDTATTEIYTLSLHDALPISLEIFPSQPPRIPCAPCFHRTDRKSTRLNSSHSQISYAVFCLKKKN